MKKHTVLIVDDIPQNIQVAAGMLRSEGYNVSFATDGREALERVEVLHPDIILLDIMMPGIDGYEVCRRLQENPTTREIPVIFLTAMNEVEAAVKGFALGGVDFINKPFNPAELLARVNTHCKIRSLQKEVEEKNIELEKVNAALEFHVAERTQELEKELVKEKSINRTTTNLVALISHEFRTPMTVIQSSIDLLSYTNDLSSEESELYKKKIALGISDSVFTVTEMLDTISDMIKVATDALQEPPVEVMVNALAYEAVQGFKQQYTPQQTIELNLPSDEIVGFCMIECITLTLHQLLRNAVQYSPKDSIIRVSLVASSKRVAFIVDDEGDGVNLDERTAIFDWYQRGSKQMSQSEKRGLGIGLSIAKQCVEHMGGDIECSDSPHGGARFEFSFPVPKLEIDGHYTGLAAALGISA